MGTLPVCIVLTLFLVTLLQPNQPIEIGYAMFDTTLGSQADNFMEVCFLH